MTAAHTCQTYYMLGVKRARDEEDEDDVILLREEQEPGPLAALENSALWALFTEQMKAEFKKEY
jgi:hypothetical protein